ncbi:hypothetical protein V500_04478 [Pseudogymnoascus sp. VKM F-4518 (FW-2643)]|nr:hypothetical protein V500_04478 [Pseudogymnoascus sp. VKM F-4518 (FW-2643)]
MASSKPPKKESKKAVAAKPAKGSKTAAKPKETSRSTERIADSDIDMDDASSEEGSDSNDEAGSAAGPDEETSSSGSSSESGSGSGSESESEDELPVKVTAPTTTLPKRSKNPSPAPTPAAQHTSTRPAPFAPPKGYTPLPASSSTNSLLTPAALANKQIWHITAPASLSLSSLKNLSLPATGAKDGDAPTISLPGGKYTVALAASTADTTRVLVPSRGGYKALAAPVGQTLHLQRVNEVGGEKYEVKKREARKQPGGLKMRFRPIGFGEEGECGEIGEADEEEEGERPQFKKHKKSGGGEVEEGEKEKERREKKERKEKKEKGKGKEKKVRKEK